MKKFLKRVVKANKAKGIRVGFKRRKMIGQEFYQEMIVMCF